MNILNPIVKRAHVSELVASARRKMRFSRTQAKSFAQVKKAREYAARDMAEARKIFDTLPKIRRRAA